MLENKKKIKKLVSWFPLNKCNSTIFSDKDVTFLGPLAEPSSFSLHNLMLLISIYLIIESLLLVASGNTVVDLSNQVGPGGATHFDSFTLLYAPQCYWKEWVRFSLAVSSCL